jgi:hypothetical protein
MCARASVADRAANGMTNLIAFDGYACACANCGQTTTADKL